MPRIRLWLPLAFSSLVLSHCHLSAQPTAEQAAHGATTTLNAQGGDYPEWFQNPHMVEFYALSVEMLRAHRGRVDVAGYEQRSYAIFRVFAESMGADPDGMIAHLNAIPREMVGIVAKDRHVLDSYESFLVALRGPT